MKEIYVFEYNKKNILQFLIELNFYSYKNTLNYFSKLLNYIILIVLSVIFNLNKQKNIYLSEIKKINILLNH